MKMRILTTLGFCLCLTLCFCQSNNANESPKQYAQRLMGVLCSPDLHGRGYVQQGEWLAAQYLAKEFEQIGAKQVLDTTWFQRFKLNANTLPGKMDFKIEGELLRPGVDYLLHPDAPSVKTKCGTVYFAGEPEMAKETVLSFAGSAQARGKVLLLDEQLFVPDKANRKAAERWEEIMAYLKYSPNLGIKGIMVITANKPVWFPSSEQAQRPLLLVRKEALPKDFSAEKSLKIQLQADAKLLRNTPSQNVLASIRGTEKPDSIIMLCAHYDHLGRMGTEAFFPGANDNASGVAMMLSLARYYSKNPPKYTMVFAAFGSEEIGLLGSRHFVEKPIFPLSKIRFLLNLDILGTGLDGITVVNGSIYKDLFTRLQQLNEQKKLLPEVKVRGEACNSDHCFFHQQKVPSFYIYTRGGISEYHNVFDKSETLTLEEFDDLHELFKGFLSGF